MTCFCTSRDGTAIAYERTGQGPAVILVDGALCNRAMGPLGALASRLEQHFTVFRYDRRGRGESGDTLPYAVEREIEDIAALISEAGGSAFVFGISSGAALALEAAARGLAIGKLALFEPPFIVDGSRTPVPADYVPQLDRLLAAGRRADVIRSFMEIVGVPKLFIFLMRFMPAWSRLKRIAHTVPYDMTIMQGTQAGKPLPTERWTSVRMPALVMDGGKSPAWMRHGVQSLAGALAGAQYRTLPGQTHMVRPEVLAPALEEFFRCA